MHKDFKVPPKSKDSLTNFETVLERINTLVGADFQFVPNKQKTNGANLRKLIASVLINFELSEPAKDGSFAIIPLKGKGIPKIKREFIDTYVVSSGDSYNLQVWNRIPNSESVLIEYEEGDPLRSKDVRFILVKINPEKHQIDSIVGMTAQYIVDNFGKFGKQTVKHQLIISEKGRANVLAQTDAILFYPDSKEGLNVITVEEAVLDGKTIHSEPTIENIISLEEIREKVATHLIGKRIEPGPTKNRGQFLEVEIANLLGYNLSQDSNDKLVGGFPDIRHQALEVKLQDSPTVDLGKFTPEFEMPVPDCLDFTTRDMRYLIALMNPDSHLVEGVILCPGKFLEKHFTHVASKSYKCQRSIPMAFFDGLHGKCVFNP